MGRKKKQSVFCDNCIQENDCGPHDKQSNNNFNCKGSNQRYSNNKEDKISLWDILFGWGGEKNKEDKK